MDYLQRLELVNELNNRYDDIGAYSLLEELWRDFPKLALVSSFGAESAVLLHLISRVDTEIPIVFIDTGKLFQETIEYKDMLEKTLMLKNIKIFKPDYKQLQKHDPDGVAHIKDGNICCYIRKVEPLERALDDCDIWISGRKRFQSSTRANIDIFEIDDIRIKVNPLAEWNAYDLQEYVKKYQLPAHPLIKDNYLSIGCKPCTTAVKFGEDPRSGRWRGVEKTECGIHKK